MIPEWSLATSLGFAQPNTVAIFISIDIPQMDPGGNQLLSTLSSQPQVINRLLSNMAVCYGNHVMAWWTTVSASFITQNLRDEHPKT